MKLTSPVVADIFNVKAQTIINWSKRGRLKCSQIGKGPRVFVAKDIVEFVDKNNINIETLNPVLWERLINPPTESTREHNLSVFALFSNAVEESCPSLKNLKVYNVVKANAIRAFK